MNLKSFDFRSLQKYLNPQSSEDLNKFLEDLPQHVGQTVLIAAGIAWGIAAALGLYTMIQVQELIELREEFKAAEALKPVVPKIRDVPISPQEVKQFVGKTEKYYNGLKFKQNGSSIIITSNNTSYFGQFREAVGHVQNGGSGWRVSLSKLCVGRECDAQDKLAIALTVNKVSVESPS